jgi:signal transduction histidine kinase
MVSDGDFSATSILLVDDRRQNLLALEATLEPLGAQLISVQSGEAALRALETRQCALILMDLMMPGIDGIETASRIKAGRDAPHTPILFLTAAGDVSGHMARAYRSGAVDFIYKPYDPDILRSKVAVFLELYVQGQRLRREETERIRQQVVRERAELERDNLQRLLLDAPAIICIFRGTEHLCEFINTAARRVLGDRDVVGKPFRDVLAGAPVSMRRAMDEALSSGGSLVDHEVSLDMSWGDRAEPGTRFFNFLYAPARDTAGVVNGVISFGFEVTEQVQARRTVEDLAARLEQALRVRDEFLAMASHELKTPLVPLKLTIDTFRNVLGRTLGENAGELDSKLDRMARQVNRLETLVHGLLDMSRITSAGLRLEYERVDLVQLTRDAVERFASEAERFGCTMQFNAPDSVVGSWDSSRLEQVITNLISNALKFGRGRPITVSLQDGQDTALLVVRDEGIGIAAENQARIFERFERAVDSKNYAGFGVGLWIARQACEAMGAKLTVQSELARGAAFRVELPKNLTASAEAGAKAGA